MTRRTFRTLVFAAILGSVGASQALAQSRESEPGPGVVEVTIIPGGGTFFTESKDAKGPSFGTYDLGGSVAVTSKVHMRLPLPGFHVGISAGIVHPLSVACSIAMYFAPLPGPPSHMHSVSLIPVAPI